MPEFELAELDYESLRESANVVNVERPPNAKALKGRKTSPADWESGPKGSDRVGLAGKGNAEAGAWKAPRKSDTETVW
jgi:hypothetical protein